MNHHDVVLDNEFLARYPNMNPSIWNSIMIADWKKNDLHIILMANPEFVDKKPHPTKKYYCISISDGARSDISVVQDASMVESLFKNGGR